MVKIKIVNAGPHKLNVVKELKDITGFGLKETKDIVDQEGTFEVPKDIALSVMQTLQDVGAVVEVV